jgi:nitrogen fixation protein FixH
MTPPARGFHWGRGVVAAFVLFVGAILLMVWISMRERVDLVADRYYEEGLAYEGRLEARRHARAEGDVRITADASGIRLVFPAALTADGITGEAHLYRPSDGSRDRRLALSPDSAGVQQIAAAGLLPGHWKVKILWTVSGVEYYAEESVFLP